MYSEMILSKDPANTLVQQFQPLLAHLAVQVRPIAYDQASFRPPQRTDALIEGNAWPRFA